MAYDEALAERLRERLDDAGVTAKRMFGGLAFLTNGTMTVAVFGDDLLVRMDPVEAEAALERLGVRRFEFAGRSGSGRSGSGRPMRGWVVVGGETLDDPVLDEWVARARAYVVTLPPKK